MEDEGQQGGFQAVAVPPAGCFVQLSRCSHGQMVGQQLLGQRDIVAGGGAEQGLCFQELAAGHHFHRVVDGTGQLVPQSGKEQLAG
ncbi:hypothetical protein D3C86_2017700 [compost metagenome]